LKARIERSQLIEDRAALNHLPGLDGARNDPRLSKLLMPPHFRPAFDRLGSLGLTHQALTTTNTQSKGRRRYLGWRQAGGGDSIRQWLE